MTVNRNKEIDAMAALQADMNAPLLPELQACVTTVLIGGGDVELIAHKFCHQLFFLPGAANRLFEWNRKRAETAIADKDANGFVWAHERPYRTEALLRTIDLGLVQGYFDPVFCRLARDVWVDCENIPQHLDDWRNIFNRTQRFWYYWMDEAERNELGSMSTRFKVWRGECNDLGVSWSLSKRTAEFFANRKLNGANGVVRGGYVHRENVFAYIDTRGEREIIVLDPKDVHVYLEYETERA